MTDNDRQVIADLNHACRGAAIVFQTLHDAMVKAGYPAIKDAKYVLDKLYDAIAKGDAALKDHK